VDISLAFESGCSTNYNRDLVVRSGKPISCLFAGLPSVYKLKAGSNVPWLSAPSWPFRADGVTQVARLKRTKS